MIHYLQLITPYNLFFQGKKTVTADRHPSNFAWDPYVVTTTDGEDATAEDSVGATSPGKGAASPPAGKSSRPKGAGVYPYYYAWNEPPTSTVPPSAPAAVVKHQGLPTTAPSSTSHASTEAHTQGPGPASESEECIGDDDEANVAQPSSSMPVLRSSVDPTLPTPETRAKSEAAKKKTRKASAAVNTSMASTASSQVILLLFLLL